jgi:chromate transporter
MIKTIDIFITFLKIGAFTFGGGYAMLPFIQSEIITKKAWLTSNEFIEQYSLNQLFDD